MKILLIAYEFPPIVAAQSIRWFYLANGLAELGADVHVICPHMPSWPDFPVGFHRRIVLHRVWPGPFVALSQTMKRRVQTQAPGAAQPLEAGGGRRSLPARLILLARRVLNTVIFPDLRTEWYPSARRAIAALLKRQTFDAVIASHEPGVDIMLGLFAQKQAGLPLIVDLADPVLAPYTPVWRRKADFAFERHALRRADRIVLTNAHVLQLLRQRHPAINEKKFGCVPQGFSELDARTFVADNFLQAGALHILFTGTFYADFRSPEMFARAMRGLAAADVQLTVVGDNAAFRDMFKGIPNLRFIGKIDHFACLGLQRQADVLLYIGNLQAYQLPGKIYEYLGAFKPILHIRTGQEDPGADLIEAARAGVVVDNTEQAIAAALRGLLDAWRAGRLAASHCPDRAAIEQYSWRHRARAYHDILLGSRANQP